MMFEGVRHARTTPEARAERLRSPRRQRKKTRPRNNGTRKEPLLYPPAQRVQHESPVPQRLPASLRLGVRHADTCRSCGHIVPGKPTRKITTAAPPRDPARLALENNIDDSRRNSPIDQQSPEPAKFLKITIAKQPRKFFRLSRPVVTDRLARAATTKPRPRGERGRHEIGVATRVTSMLGPERRSPVRAKPRRSASAPGRVALSEGSSRQPRRRQHGRRSRSERPSAWGAGSPAGV